MPQLDDAFSTFSESGGDDYAIGKEIVDLVLDRIRTSTPRCPSPQPRYGAITLLVNLLTHSPALSYCANALSVRTTVQAARVG